MTFARFLLVAALALAAAAGCGGGSAGTSAAARHTGPGPANTARPWTELRMLKAALRHLLTGTPSARPAGARGTVRVGALFYNDASGDHFCTASVVDSPHRNLLITAAHCIHSGRGGGYKQNLVFVPRYRNGLSPNGVWNVTAMTVDPRWISGSDPDMDVGFVSVAPLQGQSIQDVLGGNRLAIGEGFANIVRVVGYPDNGDEPITCINRTTKWSPTQMRFACKGYYNGTSGSPWLTVFDPKTGSGHVVGVIGGYQQGGATNQISYSPYFSADIKALYDTAVAKG